MPEETVHFRSLGQPAVDLTGNLHLPAQVGGHCPGVVLCHPQPLVADMHDALIARLAHDLATAGIAALRFNFRGVAPSAGDMTDGRMEPLDAGGAVAYLAARPEIDSTRLAMIGHAFGAIVALAYASADARIGTVIAISPPAYRLTPGFAATLDRPKLIVTGSDDEVSPQFRVEPWLAHVPGPSGVAVIPDAQHLLRGREAEASEVVCAYIQRWAQSGRG